MLNLLLDYTSTPELVGDLTRVTQIMTNLIGIVTCGEIWLHLFCGLLCVLAGNAVKFTKEGYVSVRAELSFAPAVAVAPVPAVVVGDDAGDGGVRVMRRAVFLVNTTVLYL